MATNSVVFTTLNSVYFVNISSQALILARVCSQDYIQKDGVQDSITTYKHISCRIRNSVVYNYFGICINLIYYTIKFNY